VSGGEEPTAAKFEQEPTMQAEIGWDGGGTNRFRVTNLTFFPRIPVALLGHARHGTLGRSADAAVRMVGRNNGNVK
jgi:hypothetical protein